jgi:hypothetical protein
MKSRQTVQKPLDASQHQVTKKKGPLTATVLQKKTEQNVPAVAEAEDSSNDVMEVNVLEPEHQERALGVGSPLPPS